MIWLIIAIIVIGLFIVGAINRNTQVRVALEEQRRQDELNSPENRAQETVSRRYFEHLGDVLDIKIRIAERSIEVYEKPTQRWVYFPDSEVITEDKGVFRNNKDVGAKVRLVEKGGVVKYIRQQIKEEEDLLKEIEAEYAKKQQEFPNYAPEHLDIIKAKYGLDIPFPPNEDFFNEDSVSSWSMYVEKVNKLNKLESILKRLKNPNTREATLKKLTKDRQIERGHLLDDEAYERAVALAIDKDQTSSYQLEKGLGISYHQAALIIKEMERRGIIGSADGARPRQVLKTKIDK